MVFRDVTFAYPARPEVPVLSGVSLEIRPGQQTALVGASGSGKTTVAALLFRHYDPREGEVLVDGVSLRRWDTRWLHARMAMVAQAPLLFDTTVRNNILYGCRREVPQAEMEEAAKIANAHEYISKLPCGYDTHVGGQGGMGQLSGGQQQRLSIARCVVLQPRILVLDEATSSLDSEAEGLVQEALERLMRGRTTLVIAHRLSTIREAAEIVCLREGRVVEHGPPAKLLEQRGYYWSLVRRQVCTLEDLDAFNYELDKRPLASGGHQQQRLRQEDQS